MDCARCGDPLLAEMAHCAKCGGANPSFVSREPDSFWKSDLGIEAGLFMCGVAGLLTGLIGLVSADAPIRLRLLGGLSGAVGVGALAAFHRLDAVELSTRGKWTLRFAVYTILVVMGFLQAAIRDH